MAHACGFPLKPLRMLAIRVLLSAAILASLLAYSRYQLAHFKRTSFHGADRIRACTGEAPCSEFKVTVRGEDTGGKYVVFQEFVKPGQVGAIPGYSGSPLYHIHYQQNETFTALKGTMGYCIDGSFGTLDEGSTAIVLTGQKHFFFNAVNTSDLVIEVKMEPAGLSDVFFENGAGLFHDYGSADRVNPLQMMVMLAESDISPANIPRWLWAILRSLIPPVGHLAGFKYSYPEYTTKSPNRTAGEPTAFSNPSAEGSGAMKEL